MIELQGGRSTLRVSPTVWAMSLELARLNGWEPAGTRAAAVVGAGVANDEDRALLGWFRQYTSSDGQSVVADDAARFADALSRAMATADRSGEGALTDWQAMRSRLSTSLQTPPTGFRWFTSGPGRAHLRDLAAFCRQGGFQIL